MEKKDYDAIVVGSGPNGLSAAIRLQQAGVSVLLLEAKETIGGGMRTAELTLPGFYHDICSAVHPMAVGSPFSLLYHWQITGWSSCIRRWQRPIRSMTAARLSWRVRWMIRPGRWEQMKKYTAI